MATISINGRSIYLAPRDFKVAGKPMRFFPSGLIFAVFERGGRSLGAWELLAEPLRLMRARKGRTLSVCIDYHPRQHWWYHARILIGDFDAKEAEVLRVEYSGKTYPEAA